MWVMIIKNLPIQNPPPRYSIFWSIPWPSEDAMILNSLEFVKSEMNQDDEFPPAGFSRKRKRREFDPTIKQTDHAIYSSNDTVFGCATPNWFGARAIMYGGEKIRVFPHEFAVQPPEQMNYFINQEEAFNLVPDNVAEERSVNAILDGELKPIYEAALLEGANHNQALLVALEKDITIPDADFPPIGYYLLKEEWREYLP
jgi:hypothetical protein